MAEGEQKGVFVTFGADTSGLEKGIKKAESSLKDFGKELREGINEFGKWAGAATAAGAAILAGVVVNSIDAAKELKNLASVANTSVSEFQKLAFGAKSVGIEQDKLADILKDVKDRVGDFITTGGGPMVDFFERVAPRVGVTAEQFRNLSGPQSLQLFVDSLQKANLSAAETTFYMEAMASDSTRLIPLLRDGGVAMAEQAREAERLGLVLSDIDHQNLLRAASAMDKFKGITSGFADQLGARFAPALEAALSLLSDMIKESGGVGNAADKAFSMITDGAAFAMNAIDALKRVFELAADGMIIFATKVGGAILEQVGRPIKIVAEGLSALPGEIGANADAFVKEYDAFFSQLDAVAAEAGMNMQETLMAPLAGDVFKERLKQAVVDSTTAANEALAGQTGGGSDGAGMAVSAAEEGDKAKKAEDAQARLDEEKERRAAEASQKLEDMQAGFMTENELIYADFEEKFRIAEEARAVGRLSEEQHSLAIQQIMAKRGEALKALEDKERAARKANMMAMFGDLTTLMNSGSKKAFEIGKKAAIASAVIDGYEAAVAAWNAGMSTGGPWAPLVAAAYTAASLARTGATINAIRSQQFGGGGGGGAAVGGGGGGSATTAINAAATPVNTGGNAPLEVRFTGIQADRNYSGREISALYDSLREEAGNRGMRFLPMGA